MLVGRPGVRVGRDPGGDPGLDLGIGGLGGAAEGDVEEDAGAEGEEEEGPDPAEAEGLVGLAEEEQEAEGGEGEAEGEGDGVELVAAHGGTSHGAVVVGAVRSLKFSSNGPATWKGRGSLARRTSITP